MQRQTTTLDDIVIGLGSLLFLVMLGLFLYAFWQNALFSSWLSILGYGFIAFLLASLAFFAWYALYLIGCFFARLFDTAIDFTFSSTHKAAK